MRPLFLGMAVVFLSCFHAVAAVPADKRGGIVLQFDDGWSNWSGIVAPELKKVGGTATGYVTNENILSNRISMQEVKLLQDVYHWEIGTHTWNHLNAPVYVATNGLKAWISNEVVSSITALRGGGLSIRSLVFPYNAYTPEIVRAIQPLVECYRRPSFSQAITNALDADKSFPASDMDISYYIPPEQWKSWIDEVARKDSLLFLFGHRILPDSSYVTGRVVSVTATSLTAAAAVTLPEGTLALVPDLSRRSASRQYLQVRSASGNTVVVNQPILMSCTTPGAAFLIGPAYSTRLSDFRAMVEYAAARVKFYTVHEAVTRSR